MDVETGGVQVPEKPVESLSQSLACARAWHGYTSALESP